MVKPEPGDKILVKTYKEEVKGIMVESYEPGVLLLKLDSGYNIGLSKENITEIKLLEKAKPKVDEINFKLTGRKPRIDLIMTGGTISSSLDSKTGGVKYLTSPEKLFSFYPEIFEFCDINVINPFMKWSENMSSEDWIKIAKIAVKSLKDPGCSGVIVTHGTDFLHYTASALSFMIKDLNKPLALTYSQRSTDRASSDAELNLYCAAKYALSDIAEVALVGHANINDEYCYALPGTKTRKMHSSRRDTFKPINSTPIAKVYKDKIEYLRTYKKKNKSEPELISNFEEKIALIKFYPGQSGEIIEDYLKKGYKGLVIEVAGIGQVLTEGKGSWVPYIREATKKGMIICATAQTIYGRVDSKVYSAGRELEKAGMIYLEDMLSETAFVKLGWILGQVNDTKIKKEDLKKKLLENISGEFNERLGKEFLE